jgi:hypothetical protein
MKSEKHKLKIYQDRLARKRELYKQNKEVILAKQERFRYPKSLQRVVDANWPKLCKMDNKKLYAWAIEQQLNTSARKMICFWSAIKKNKNETASQVKRRLTQFDKLNNNKRKYVTQSKDKTA